MGPLRLATPLFILAAAACGRTDPLRSAPAPAQYPQPVIDAGVPDAGQPTPDAGPIISDAGLCPQSADAGFFTGTTPLGPFSAGYLWVGTEAPTTHSCPHITVHASQYPPGSQNVAVVSIDFDTFSEMIPALPFDLPGQGTLYLGDTMLLFGATGHFTRADGLTQGHTLPYDSWRTALTIDGTDAGFSLTGAVDTLECPGSTWECL
ncbi:MAG: hypothetical protein QM723_13455 [Myxococcaceae bacterium]